MAAMKERLQRVGGFLAAMVIPNIAAIIAWGLITALFIPTGWWPNEKFAQLVGPMIRFLLPLLIGYTGGKLVYDTRGGVVGAAATMGMVVGTDVPRRHDHGTARWLVDQEDRSGARAEDPGRLRDADQQLQRRHPRAVTRDRRTARGRPCGRGDEQSVPQ